MDCVKLKSTMKYKLCLCGWVAQKNKATNGNQILHQSTINSRETSMDAGSRFFGVLLLLLLPLLLLLWRRYVRIQLVTLLGLRALLAFPKGTITGKGRKHELTGRYTEDECNHDTLLVLPVAFGTCTGNVGRR